MGTRLVTGASPLLMVSGILVLTMPSSTLTFPIRSNKLTMSVEIEDHLCHRKSEFQTIDIYATDAFGKMLFLDGHVQLASLDEYAYHESLVHVPLMGLDSPRRALVVGGGDGGVLREICRHGSMRHVDMVEIDVAVVEESRRHLPELSAGAFDDPRVHLHIGDAFAFVKGDHDPYDLIVVDATDVYEEVDGELSEMLFTKEFYEDCLRLLSPSGFVVTQADNLLFCPYSLDEIAANFRKTFPCVGSYWALVPSFGGFSGYCWAGRSELRPVWRDIPGLQYLTPQLLDLAHQPVPIR